MSTKNKDDSQLIQHLVALLTRYALVFEHDERSGTLAHAKRMAATGELINFSEIHDVDLKFFEEFIESNYRISSHAAWLVFAGLPAALQTAGGSNLRDVINQFGNSRENSLDCSSIERRDGLYESWSQCSEQPMRHSSLLAPVYAGRGERRPISVRGNEGAIIAEDRWQRMEVEGLEVGKTLGLFELDTLAEYRRENRANAHSAGWEIRLKLRMEVSRAFGALLNSLAGGSKESSVENYALLMSLVDVPISLRKFRESLLQGCVALPTMPQCGLLISAGRETARKPMFLDQDDDGSWSLRVVLDHIEGQEPCDYDMSFIAAPASSNRLLLIERALRRSLGRDELAGLTQNFLEPSARDAWKLAVDLLGQLDHFPPRLFPNYGGEDLEELVNLVKKTCVVLAEQLGNELASGADLFDAQGYSPTAEALWHARRLLAAPAIGPIDSPQVGFSSEEALHLPH